MDVRELTAADREAATALWTESGLVRPWNDPEGDFDRALAGSMSCVLGASDQSGLAATVMVGHDGHRGWVYYLAVSPRRRGEGLGRRLVDEAERWLRERGAVKLNVMVRHSNAGTLGFYQHLGYADADVTVVARWLRDPA